HRQTGHRDQLVRGLKGVEHGRESEVEDMIQCQDIHPHGNNDIKYGIRASRRIRLRQLFSAMPHQGGMQRRCQMVKLSLFVRLEAKPGKEQEVAAFLKQGLELANHEATTPIWFALQLGPSTFAIFDAFRDESGREAHLSGPIAQALMANAPTLLAS